VLRFAWWSLRGRWERLITVCLGLICIAICATLLANLTQLSALTTDRQISRHWNAPYDLLVRAPAALSPVERQLQVVDPAAPEQTYGGITLAQVKTIAHIPHVAVAAPEAVVGWVTLRPYVLLTFTQSGLYRVTDTLAGQPAWPGDTSSSSLANYEIEVLPLTVYREAANMQNTPDLIYTSLNAAGTTTVAVSWPLPSLLVGIDPGAEQQLVGLRWRPSSAGTGGANGLPLLMDTHPWATLTASVKVEKSSALPSGSVAKQSAAGTWLPFANKTYNSQGLLALLARELSGHSAPGGVAPLQGGGITRYARIGYAPSSSDASGLNVLSMGSDTGGLLTRLPLLPAATTPWVTFGNGGSFATFDAAHLPLLKNDAALSVPSGLYQPAPAQSPAGLFPQHSINLAPPLLFTTVNAACTLIGAQCISAVRVRIASLGSYSPRSEALVQQVAADIEARTGLHVDVLDGASGRPLSVQIPVSGSRTVTTSETWIQPHAAVTVATGVNSANILLLLSEVGVAALALIAAALLATASRRRDMAILARVGWFDREVVVASIAESAATVLLAALPAWALALLLDALGISAVAPTTLLIVLSVAALLYVIASLVTTWAALSRRENPSSEEFLTTRALSWRWKMALDQVYRRKGSSLLLMIAIAGACALIGLLFLVYWGLDGILYTTLLGRLVQVSLSSIHLVTAIMTCASAALTSSLIELLMVRERRKEFGILLAIGWKGHTVAGEVLREGMALGALGGLVGGFVAVCVFLAFYQVWSPLILLCIPGAIVAGALLAVLGTLYPALLAARLLPKQVLVGA
jgi:putative ABC transport system permease protein